MILSKIEKGDEGHYKIQFPENVTLCDIIEMQTALTYALAKLDNSGEEETHSYYLNLLAELFRLPEKKDK